MLFVFSALIVLSATNAGFAAECHSSPDPNAKQNLNPVSAVNFTLVTQIPNAKLYSVKENTRLKILHLWGTPYQMGYAHGAILKEDVSKFFNQVWSYLEDQVVEAVNGTVDIFPQWFLRDVASFGLDAACDLEVAVTSKFTGEYFNQELKGLSDASGVDLKKIQRIHMLGELTKGSCSMFGAWGSALPTNQGVLQLRALDWNMDGPFSNYPQITVYHPNSNVTDQFGMTAHDFLNIGWTGWVGSITGVSISQVAISEIGVSDPDESFGKESRFGVPFTYILRDILEFDVTLDDALNRIANSHRTCDLILGVGDGKENRGFRGVQYSASVANFYDDQNMRPDEDWHPKIDHVVYYGMDWLCPGYSRVLAKQLMKHHGSLTPEVTIKDIVPIVQTGSTHIAIYDLTNGMIYTSFSKSTDQTGPPAAYDRPFLSFNFMDVLNETI